MSKITKIETITNGFENKTTLIFKNDFKIEFEFREGQSLFDIEDQLTTVTESIIKYKKEAINKASKFMTDNAFPE